MYVDPGSTGLPSWYPTPPADPDLLFYIQRNQNQDAIVYRVNRAHDGLINQSLPMDAYWIKYTEGGIRQELNVIQNKLAFGYQSEMISSLLYRFQFVAYKELDFFIVPNDQGSYEVHIEMHGKLAKLTNIYVYALEFGVFPDVKYIELYGEDLDSGTFAYRKITIE